MNPDPLITIYLVEDDDEDALLFRLALAASHPGCQLQRFLNGKALLDNLLTQNPAGLIGIFLDLGIPVQNGLETLVQIRQQPKLAPIPVAILTGSDYHQHSRQAFQAGCTAYFIKPASVQELAGLLEPTLTNWLKKE